MRQHVLAAIAIIFGIVIPIALVVLLLVAANWGGPLHLLELDPKLRAIEPYDLAGPSLFVRYRKFECRWNPIGGLHLQTCSGRR
jgi:hypothetical protein